MITPSPDNQPDAIVDSFRATWQAKAALPPRPIATPGYCGRVGLFLGIVIALMYGFVSQVINKFAMPDVPFSQHPIGLIGNLVIIMISDVAMGLVCAAPERSSNGVVRASAVVVLAVIAQALAAYAAFSDPLPPALVAAIGIGLLYITALPASLDKTHQPYSPNWICPVPPARSLCSDCPPLGLLSSIVVGAIAG